MDRTQLLQHFDTLAETPGAVAKLREFILELAERGTFGGAGAKKVPLHSVAEFVMGQAPAGTECNETGEGTVFVKAGEFGSLYAEVRCWTTRPLKFARKGDVLICVVGATVGKLNLAIDSAIGRSVAAIRPSEQLDTRFLYYSLMPFTLRLRRASRGSAQGVIGREELRGISISFPPLAEQRRIVVKVEELLALCDELEARQTAAREHRTRLVRSALDHFTTAKDETNFKRHSAFCIQHSELLFDSVPALRQAILSIAVLGHIVPQNPREGTGDDTVKSVLKQRGIKSSTLENASEDLPKLPADWAAVAMTDIFEVVGGIQKTPLRAPRHNAFPYLRVANVQRGRLNLDDVQKFELLDGELDRWRLEPKDVLVVEGNGSENEIGRCARWQGELRDCVHQNHIIRCRPCGHDARFAILFLNSPVGIAEMKRRAITTSGLYSLSVGKIRSLTVPFPPLAEQQRIVAKVDELMRWCDALEARLTAAQTSATHLLDATLCQILKSAA